MAFSFDIALDKGVDVAQKLDQACKMAEDSPYDICLTGNEDSGDISGLITGSYVVDRRADEQALTVTIKRKPMILSQAKIQQTIKKFFV